MPGPNWIRSIGCMLVWGSGALWMWTPFVETKIQGQLSTAHRTQSSRTWKTITSPCRSKALREWSAPTNSGLMHFFCLWEQLYTLTKTWLLKGCCQRIKNTSIVAKACQDHSNVHYCWHYLVTDAQSVVARSGKTLCFGIPSPLGHRCQTWRGCLSASNWPHAILCLIGNGCNTRINIIIYLNGSWLVHVSSVGCLPLKS